MFKNLDIMWIMHMKIFNSFQILENKISKYIKLDELVQVISFVENECCFFTLTFMKTKLWNQLTKHLELVICLFNEKFFTL